MAGEVVNRQVVVNIVADDVLKAQETLLTRQKKLNEEIKKTNDPKALADLNKQLKATEQQIDRNNKVLKGDLLPTYNQLTSAVKKYYAEWKKTGDPEVLKRYQEANTLLKMQKDQLNKVEGAAKGLSNVSIFKSAFWANLAAGAVTGFFSSFSGFLQSSVDEALQADLSTRRLKSTLDNLGRSDAFDRLSDKADEMAQKFRYLDNDDVIAVFEKLIDYGKLTEKEMNNLLPVIIDFSAKTGASLEESTSVIIKALEGNGKALKEYGINIKDAGTESERLNVIMTTLKSKVDGAGEAFQNSASGGIAVARQELANLKEDIGNEVLPVLNKLYSFALGALKGIKQFAVGVKNAILGATGNSLDSEASTFAASENNKKFLESLYGMKGITPEAIKNGITNEISFLNSELEKTDPLLKSATDKLNGFRAQVERGDSKLTKANIEYGENLAAEEQDLKNRQSYLKERIKLLDEELKVNNNTKALGIDPGSEAEKEKQRLAAEAQKKLLEEQKKALEERKRLLQDLDKIQFDQSLVGIPQLDKDLKLMDKKYAELRTRAKGETEILIRIEQLYLTERVQLIDSYAEKEINAWKKTNEKVATEQDKQILKNLQRLRDRADALLNGENDGSIKKQNAAILQEQEDEKNARNQRLQEYLGYASQVSDILSTIGQAQSARENAELDRDRKANEKKEQNLQNRLRKGLISQSEYDRQMAAISQAQEKREKEIEIRQFNRNKRISIIQAIINGAQAASKTLAELGFPAAIPALALLAASIGAQIAVITAQKPTFARGGKLGGRLHSEGGNPIMDGNGNKIAEIERGEGIINRRSMADNRSYTLSGTPSQIASTLNGMHGGIRWETPARFINYGALNKRYYAAGGTFGGDANNTGSMDTAQLMEILNRLDSTLKRGVKAYTVLTDQEDAQTRLATIRAEATMK